MDDLLALLDACRQAVGARVAALVGDDGLLIERTGADEDGASDGYDLEWTAAEATDLRNVADRLTSDALGAGPTTSLIARTGDLAVRLERCGEGAFVLLVGDAAAGATALPDDLRVRLAEATA